MLTEFNIGVQDIDSLIRVIHHILYPDLEDGHIADAKVDAPGGMRPCVRSSN